MKMLKHLLIAAALLGVTTPALSDASTSWTPPAQVGDVYVVIGWKMTVAGTADATKIRVEWGAWRPPEATVKWSSSLKTPAKSWNDSGVVIKLKHTKPDSIPLKITTTGTIKKGPVQSASAISEWSNPNYQQLTF